MVDVKCPRCGATFPYSQIAKQLVKRRFDPNAILKIIKDSGEVGITTGQLFEKYRVNSQLPFMSLRHLNSIVKELEKDGKVTTKRLCMGSRGRTTLIKAINNTDLTSITSSYVHHV